MVKKMRRVRTFARTAAKSMEKRLIENAKQIKKDPYIILPDYDDSHSEKLYRGQDKVPLFLNMHFLMPIDSVLV